MTENVWRLDQIQRWMQAIITHPDGVEAALDSDQARTEIDVSSNNIDRIVNPSQQCTSVERLEVYANAYYARLLECLRDEFPALFHALGEEVFDGMAFGYLQSYPSKSYTLANLSTKFPDYLAETRPTDEADADVPSWPDFLIDLARLERTYSEVFDGPGIEGAQLLKAEQIAAVLPDDWPRARLVTVPCLRLLALSYPVHEYATGVRKKEEPPIPDPEPTWLAVSRIDYVVRRWPLSRPQYDLLQSLIGGETVGQAIEKAANVAIETDPNLEQLTVNLRAWFEEWSAAGFFRTIELPATRAGA